jgi:hypothetical protein
MTQLNVWLPVDINNPIPKPENERQVLCIYRPDHDTGHHRAHDIGPYTKGPAKHGITCDPEADHEKYLYFDHGWMRKIDNEKVEFIYDTNYLKDLQYCITEFPPIPGQ